MLLAHLWPVLCVQDWDEKYTALKFLFMILKLSLIGIVAIWKWWTKCPIVQYMLFFLAAISQGQQYVIIFGYPGQDLRSWAGEAECAQPWQWQWGGRRDSVTAPRTRDMSWVLCLVAAHKQQTQHFQCFHNNSQHFYGHWAVLYLHTYSKVPSKIQQTTTARYQSLVNCLECLRIET